VWLWDTAQESFSVRRSIQAEREATRSKPKSSYEKDNMKGRNRTRRESSIEPRVPESLASTFSSPLYQPDASEPASETLDNRSTIAPAASPGHDFSQLAVIGAQVDVTVSQPDDVQEQEADRIAEEVMRTDSGQDAKESAPDERGSRRIHRKAADSGVSPDAGIPANSAGKSGAQPLDSATRGLMESRFAHDFSHVRVYADEAADQSARALNARAYTIGNEITFKSGEYSPHTQSGRLLLAHELTHVLQEEAGTSTGIIHRQKDPAGGAAPATAPAPGAGSEPAKGASIVLGSFTVSTFDALLAAEKFFAAQLTTDAAEVPKGETSRTAADELVEQAKGWEGLLQSKGNAELDQATVAQARVWYDAFVQASKNLDSYKKAKARKDMEKADADNAAARAANDAIAPSFATAQRACFLGKKHEMLEKITATLGASLQVGTALLEVHEKTVEAVTWLTVETSHASEFLEKCTPIVEKAHQVVAAYELLHNSLVAFGGGEGATEMDKTMSKVGAGFGIASAAGSLTGMASAYMVYFGAILMVGQSALRVAGAILREHGHEFNLYLFETDPGAVDWSVEPGGRETYEFMVQVMRAGSSQDIPMPLPKEVDKFVVESREELKEGTGEEVPTSGFWFWRHSDKDKVQYWLMKNRRNVWAMLYGALEPPA